MSERVKKFTGLSTMRLITWKILMPKVVKIDVALYNETGVPKAYWGICSHEDQMEALYDETGGLRVSFWALTVVKTR